MKQLFLIIAAMLLLHSTRAQVIRDNRKPPVKTEKTPTTPVATNPSEVVLLMDPKVVLYDQAGFGGQSKSLGVGDYRFFSAADLNDGVSSIRVPNGMVAVIYEHANEKGGYGNYIDLMEDCKDLSAYGFNDKASYLRVFNASRPGYVYVRNRKNNNQFVAGHWERQRADGKNPDNSLPAIASSLSPTGFPDDYTDAPLATQAEIDEFNDVQNNQSGVAVLGGETTQPFYYHHNQPGEAVYKYNKVIDPARLPGEFFNWLSDKLGDAGFLVKPFEVVTDIATDIKDWIFGSSSTKMKMDCWFPVSEYRKTVCGKLRKDVHICTQDYLHTQVTIDKDACFNLVPSERFASMLTNRWTNETSTEIEGEVKPKHHFNYNTQTGKSTENTTPVNPLLLEIKKDENICLYGAWMGDIMDLNVKVPIPLTDVKIDVGNIDLRKNNEIHPVNQLWRKKGNETQLMAIVDGTGYFQKTGNGEIAASGLNQRMRFYKAFLLPAGPPKVTQVKREVTIDGIGFHFTENPVLDIQPETLTVKYKGMIGLTVKDNSLVTGHKTHKVFFDKVRTRADGSLQGYIVVETEPITRQGGSINIFMKESASSGVYENDGRPVRTRD